MNYSQANKIAKQIFREELSKLNLNSMDLDSLTISGYEETNSFVFELYVPSEKPIDARVIAKVEVFKKNGDTTITKFDQ